MTTRRAVLGGLAAATTLPLLGGAATATPAPTRAPSRTPGVREVRDLERAYDATIGFYAARVCRGARVLAHRAEERAPIHSVFKSYAAAAVLRDLDRDGETLDRLVRYTREDLVTYSPVTEPNVEVGMTVRELCDAAVRISDNTAANLLLRELGGPSSITRFARSIGDRATRLDRWETELNSAIPGDPRDTTTPRQVAQGYAALLVGDALSPADREILRDWMLRNTTSDRRFRRGLPDGWALADKTGSGTETFNDAGVVFPAGGGTPFVLSAFVRLSEPDVAASEEIHTELARIAVRRLG
ncbi:class A beta-lactamase [Nocardioides sp. CFH 31398]|uniref:class A beta-lactamase n=1 Tax=Nocardioides sp. CFH 31398 TaxID=2919579 RepID=UPI001F05F6A0|nr:class A beta-lactamase [Nocardioides sp. CFH 31398]MCH1867985.1 class A beta-lactamase [Nocardioides sp. CFH 31398]